MGKGKVRKHEIEAIIPVQQQMGTKIATEVSKGAGTDRNAFKYLSSFPDTSTEFCLLQVLDKEKSTPDLHHPLNERLSQTLYHGEIINNEIDTTTAENRAMAHSKITVPKSSMCILLYT